MLDGMLQHTCQVTIRTHGLSLLSFKEVYAFEDWSEKNKRATNGPVHVLCSDRLYQSSIRRSMTLLDADLMDPLDYDSPTPMKEQSSTHCWIKIAPYR